MSKKIFRASGKRKSAVARATIKPGTGIVRVNSVLLDVFQPKIARMKIREPLVIAGDVAGKSDLSRCGGGFLSQA